MLQAGQIWRILLEKMPRDQWVELETVYRIVESSAALDAEDMEPSAPGFQEPKWRRNVRNVLQRRKQLGKLRGDGQGRYWLPSAATGQVTAPADFDEVWEALVQLIDGGVDVTDLVSGSHFRAQAQRDDGIALVGEGVPSTLPREWLRAAWEQWATTSLLTAEHLPEAGRSYAGAVLGLLALLPYVESVCYPRAGVFRTDRPVTDLELSRIFGVGLQRGIRYAGTAEAPHHVVIITAHRDDSGDGHPYQDAWDGDVLRYTGEGQEGDQALTRGNLALSRASDTDTPIYGFERQSDGTFRYLGRFCVEQVSEAQQADRQGASRRVYVFHLRQLPKRAGNQGASLSERPSTDGRTPFTVPTPIVASPERAYPLEPLPTDWDWPEQMRRLLRWVEASGFVFEPWQIAAYVTALRTKPFVILAGISGTGKTRLPQLVARACGQRCEVIPVRPDWTDSSDLLGYTDLTGTFRPGPLLELARQAQEDPQRSYVVVLDEMNLARVEHYFAEVLSRIEDRRLESGRWVSKPLLGAAQTPREQGGTEAGAHAWGQVGLPPNLALVGTVNMDESTHGFSRKVLDRAFTLELAETRLAKWGAPGPEPGETLDWPASVLVPRVDSLAHASGLDDQQRQQVERAIGALEQLNGALRQAQLQVGYRVRDEVALFVLHAADVRDAWATSEGVPVDPLDLAISMKVLPRIVGGSGAIRRVLQQLLAWAIGDVDPGEEATEQRVRQWAEAGRPSAQVGARFPRCAARLCLMWERMMDDGFTSYWL